jgi:hypothetical protein
MSSRERGLAAAGVLFLLLLDLTAYFQSASRIDMRFTELRGWQGVVPSAAERAALATPWPLPAPERGFDGGLAQAMPLSNLFWPFNRFMLPADLPRSAIGAFPAFLRSAPPFVFYDGATAIPEGQPMPSALAGDLPSIDRELRVAGPLARMGAASVPVREGFEYRWKRLRYNDFEVEVVVPRDGWLMARQLFDRNWRVEVDGSTATAYKANYVSMAVPIAAGPHVLRWEYRPLARSLYWPAAALLEWVVAVLLVLSLRGAASASSRPRR